MSDDVTRFVARSRVLVLGTTSPGGLPFATPLWFAADGTTLHVTTGPASWAGRNVTADPRVTLLLGGERGRADRRRLRLEGTATVRTGRMPARLALTLARRYYLAPRRLLGELAHVRRWRHRLRYYGQATGPFGWIEVRVTAARFLPGG